jgi:hypothetical protein
MDQDRTVTATFDLKTYPLDVNKTGAGSGTVTSNPSGINCGDNCSYDYVCPEEVTLTATAEEPCSKFTGWSGDCDCSGTGDCIVTMNQDRTVTADFAIADYSLTLTKFDDDNPDIHNGVITSVPNILTCNKNCQTVTTNENVVCGTVVTLTVSKSDDFEEWTGVDCVGGNNNKTCTFTVDGNYADEDGNIDIIAHFDYTDN